MVINHNLSATSTLVAKDISNRFVSMNLVDLNKKSFFFEVVNRKNPSDVLEAFILNIPPENVEIEEPQRVTRTKTFGGTFVDDYGPDNIRIIISGNTGGTTLRKTYTLDTEEPFDGKSAFFYFRNHIMRYKTRTRKYADYDIVLYDLSSAFDAYSVEGHGAIRSGRGMDAYVVSLEKFKLTRSKEKPLFYNYTIEVETLRVLGTYNGEALAPVKKSRVFVNQDKSLIKQDKPLDWIVNLRRGFGSINSIFAKIRSVKSAIESGIELLEEVTTKITGFWEGAVDILTYPTGLAKRFLGATRNILDELDDIPESTLLAVFTVIEDAYAIVDITKQIGAAAASLVVFGKTPEALGLEKIPLNDAPNNTGNVNVIYGDLSDTEAEITTAVLVQYNETALSEVTDIYGYTYVTADAGTTMEKLAADYYNDPNLWELIAVLNDIKDDSEITVGDTIKMPVLLQGGTSTSNFIYTEDTRDVYGSDIRLDGDGNIIAAAAGDFSRVEGTDNLVQALNVRLNETLGARLRLTVYGIRNAVGSAATNAPITYIIANIRDTVMQDPRVVAVDNIKLRGVGDALFISFDTKTIKVGDVITFKGTV